MFNQALSDAVFPGGRRVRPILAMLAAEVFASSQADALAAAVTVEYLHCSALIFDDLPAMDDAMERRGRPCLHLRYGEGIALMTGLALINSAYRSVALRASCNASANCKALPELAACIAAQISGQAAELAPESMEHFADAPVDRASSLLKTSALFRLALTLGPTLCNAPASDVAALGRVGQIFGEAYQLMDDSLDIEEDMTLLTRGRSATTAMILGCDSARAQALHLLATLQQELPARLLDTPAVCTILQFAASLCA
ncbi:MAG: polyprenyl synthetase family protein [Acidobacteriaceae bacterium]